MLSMQPTTVYLSLGANLGNKEQTLNQAVAILSAEAGTLLRRSSFFYSEPWGFRSEHSFCNICISMLTTLTPLELLDLTQDIERRLGRTKKSSDRVYHDRTIDIDLLIYEGVEMQTPRLTLPHPLMQERDFVMIPLREIL